MEVVINELNWDEPFLLKLPSKPNIGDGIWLTDFNLDKVYPELRKEIERYSRFVITDVVCGKFQEFTKIRWIIQGNLE